MHEESFRAMHGFPFLRPGGVSRRVATLAVLVVPLALTPVRGVDARSASLPGGATRLAIDHLLLQDPLTSAAVPPGASAKRARGGEFTPRGWRALANGDFLMIELASAYGFEGMLEIELRDLDWVRANTAAGRDKVQFLGMFSNPRAELHVEDGGTNVDALWSLRGGKAPGGGPAYGERFAVLQASRGAKRADPSDFEESVAPMVPGWKWDKAVHVFRIVWSKRAGQLLGYVDDRLMFHEPWANQVTPLRYIYLAKGPDFGTMIGPSFANLRVFGSPRGGESNPTPTVSLLQPRNGAVFPVGIALELLADAQDDGRIVRVEYFEGERKIGVTAEASFGLKLPPMREGWYTFSAEATDDRGAKAKSHPRYVTIGAPWKPWGLAEGSR
jgi:hypothetical protein